MQGKASGNRGALWLRAKMQDELFSLGSVVHAHAGKVLFLGVLILATFCVGLKSAAMESSIDRLWVEGRRIILIPFMLFCAELVWRWVLAVSGSLAICK